MNSTFQKEIQSAGDTEMMRGISSDDDDCQLTLDKIAEFKQQRKQAYLDKRRARREERAKQAKESNELKRSQEARLQACGWTTCITYRAFENGQPFCVEFMKDPSSNSLIVLAAPYKSNSLSDNPTHYKDAPIPATLTKDDEVIISKLTVHTKSKQGPYVTLMLDYTQATFTKLSVYSLRVTQDVAKGFISEYWGD